MKRREEANEGQKDVHPNMHNCGAVTRRGENRKEGSRCVIVIRALQTCQSGNSFSQGDP